MKNKLSLICMLLDHMNKIIFVNFILSSIFIDLGLIVLKYLIYAKINQIQILIYNL